MNSKQIDELIKRRGLTLEDVADMPVASRAAFGLPTVVPSVDYNRVQRFAENFLPKVGVIRAIFGLDREVPTLPTMSFGDDSTVGRNWSLYQSETDVPRNRKRLYEMVEEMDRYGGIVGSGLEIYAEEATQVDDQSGKTVWIQSDDTEIQSQCMKMLSNIGFEEHVLAIVRSIAKYGDCFEQIIASEDEGIKGLRNIYPDRLTRVEDEYGRLQGFTPGIVSEDDIKDKKKRDKLSVSKPWEVIHFRLLSSDRSTSHGQTLLMPAMRVWRSLKILEDSLVVYRINRATDKDIYYIDTGQQAPEQQWQSVHTFRRELRKRFVWDQASRSMRQEYNPRTPDEDLFIPVPKDSKTRVERLAGANPQGDIYDVDHFRRSLLAALRIPSGFLGFDSDTPSKATLASQDIRFARSIIKLQRSVKSGVETMCRIHLALLGRPDAATVKFKVMMAPINYIVESMKAELFSVRSDIVTKMLSLAQSNVTTDPESGAPVQGSGSIKNVDGWSAWVLRTFLGLDDSMIELLVGNTDAGKSREMVALQQVTESVVTEPEQRSRLLKMFDLLAEGDKYIPSVDAQMNLSGAKLEMEKKTDIDDYFNFEEEAAKLEAARRAALRLPENHPTKCACCGSKSLQFVEFTEGPALFCSNETCGEVIYLE